MRPFPKVPETAAFGHFSKELLKRQIGQMLLFKGSTFKSEDISEIQVKL